MNPDMTALRSHAEEPHGEPTHVVPGVQSSLEELGREIDQAQREAHLLVDNIAPVLRDQDPDVLESAQACDPGDSALASQISRMAGEVSRLRGVLSHASSRVDV